MRIITNRPIVRLINLKILARDFRFHIKSIKQDEKGLSIYDEQLKFDQQINALVNDIPNTHQSTPIIRMSDSSEFLLAASIPQLQPDSFSIQFHCLYLEVNT